MTVITITLIIQGLLIVYLFFEVHRLSKLVVRICDINIQIYDATRTLASIVGEIARARQNDPTAVGEQ